MTTQPVTPVTSGELLALLMRRRGITQTDLAAEVGITLQHLNRAVNGRARVSSEVAGQLARALGVPPLALLAVMIEEEKGGTG